jgi:hypothetical protein
MFISCEDQIILGFDAPIGNYKYRCKIVDSDFEEVIVADLFTIAILITFAVIEIYEKRNLPVAPNLIRGIIWQHKEYNYNISDILVYNKLYIPKFAKYEKDIENYLLLI